MVRERSLNEARTRSATDADVANLAYNQVKYRACWVCGVLIQSASEKHPEEKRLEAFPRYLSTPRRGIQNLGGRVHGIVVI